MKRANNLIQKIICFDNLQLAFYKAQKGKWYKPEVIEYRKNLNGNLQKLSAWLQAELSEAELSAWLQATPTVIE